MNETKEYIDAKFVKRYGEQYDSTVKALVEYKKGIENSDFPGRTFLRYGFDIQDSLKEWKKKLKNFISTIYIKQLVPA